MFLALLHVLRYFNRPGLTFEQNAAIPNYVFGPAQVRSFLEARLFGAPLSAWIHMPQELLDSFGGHVDRIDVVLVAVPLMVLAAVATHLTARASLRQQATAAPVEAAAGPTDVAMRVMRATPWIFPLGVLLGGLFAAFPIAILLYWLTNNLWTLVQQRIVFRRFAAEEAARPVPVVVPEPVVPSPEPRRRCSRSQAGRRPTPDERRFADRRKGGGRTAWRHPPPLMPPYRIRTRDRPAPNLRGPRSVLSGTDAGRRTEEETAQMATTARRIGRIAAASAASAGLLLAGAGPALADDPGTSATQGPITLSPEQATFVCTQRIPAILARIDRVTARINADVATRGSTGVAAGAPGPGRGRGARRRGRPDPEAHRRAAREARLAGRREGARHRLPRRELCLVNTTTSRGGPPGRALLVLVAALAALVLGGCRPATAPRRRGLDGRCRLGSGRRGSTGPCRCRGRGRSRRTGPRRGRRCRRPVSAERAPAAARLAGWCDRPAVGRDGFA